MRIAIPELSLVVMVGAAGAGKSTFAARNFGDYEVVSSDQMRAMVSNDPGDQGATGSAFELLHALVARRLQAGLLTVVDATNVQPFARRYLLDLARQYDVPAIAIVLNVPEHVSQQQNLLRGDLAVPASVVTRQSADLFGGLTTLPREGFEQVHLLSTQQQVGESMVIRQRAANDLRHESGPFDLVGDVHGCFDELRALLGQLGYVFTKDDSGRLVSASHPHGRRAIFLGDLVDQGPDSAAVLRLVMGMVREGNAHCLTGLHEQALGKALLRPHLVTGIDLRATVNQILQQGDDFVAQVLDLLATLPAHLILDGGQLVVAHAGLPQEFHGRSSERVRRFALTGQLNTDECSQTGRCHEWVAQYSGRAKVVYGHSPVVTSQWFNNTICLDTGCVFGGSLSALRYPEMELANVPAKWHWAEATQPLTVVETALTAMVAESRGERAPIMLLGLRSAAGA